MGRQVYIQQRNSCGQETVSQPAGRGSDTPVARLMSECEGVSGNMARSPKTRSEVRSSASYDSTVNTIISSVAKYFKSPSHFSVRSPIKNKDGDGWRLTVSEHGFLIIARVLQHWRRRWKQANEVHASVPRNYAKRVFDH